VDVFLWRLVGIERRAIPSAEQQPLPRCLRVAIRDKIEGRLTRIKRMPQLIRSFFVVYITGC
jgi:hypothetical protein